MQRWHLTLLGVVQGIGLRPLIFNLSKKYALTGWVQNTDSNVSLAWEGNISALEAAKKELENKLSLCASNLSKQVISCKHDAEFTILDSKNYQETSDLAQGLISPDIKTCEDCLNELHNPQDRRFQYPFITCAQCGPRFTICTQLPFDRKHTAMADFSLCDNCSDEYHSPDNRRFHAQTISCWHCGPTLSLVDSQGIQMATQFYAIKEAALALVNGKILAVKGIGGFHLMTLASHTFAIEKLRAKKQRPDKPFALMVKDLAQAQAMCELSPLEQEILCSSAAPIVLLKKRESATISVSDLVSPKQTHHGLMMAYSPLHTLLLSLLPGPLVATSANRHHEPLCYDNDEAMSCLQDIADLFLFHNRAIIRPLEDSVMREIDTKARFIRRARGHIPFSIPAPFSDENTLGLGGHLKSTIALYSQDKIYVSGFIGDLNTTKSLQKFNQEILQFNNIAPITGFCRDLHPEYGSSIEAAYTKSLCYAVQHHQAHVFAVMAEHALQPPLLGFAWDGLGLGEDNAFWGGEAFLVEDSSIKHVATLLPFTLPGKERAIRDPYRIVLSLLNIRYGKDLKVKEEDKLLYSIINNPDFSPNCTSMGRLFDAIGVLLGFTDRVTFEGQAAIYVEQLASQVQRVENGYPVKFINKENKWFIDWRVMLSALLFDIDNQVSKPILAFKFHAWCANVVLNVAKKFNTQQIILSGGVFQNKCLTELCILCLRSAGYQVYCAEQLPCNDSALAVGQVYLKNYVSRNTRSDTVS